MPRKANASKSLKSAPPARSAAATAKKAKDAKPIKNSKPAKAAKETQKDKEKVSKKEAKPTKVAAPPKEAPKKRRSKSGVVRLKAYWGVFNQMMKRIQLFEYSERRQADKKAAELTGSAKSPHFVQLVKEVIRDAE
jgi:hypothetical protein